MQSFAKGSDLKKNTADRLASCAFQGETIHKAHFLSMDLPHSDDSFAVAFPAENTESFLEGHNRAFAHFGGVPNTILYDNTRIAVAKITGSGERKPTEAFSELQSHYLFAAKFGRRGKGSDKGNVEGLVAMRGATSWCRGRA